MTGFVFVCGIFDLFLLIVVTGDEGGTVNVILKSSLPPSLELLLDVSPSSLKQKLFYLHKSYTISLILLLLLSFT